MANAKQGYNLSYTAKQIDNKLSQVESNTLQIASLRSQINNKANSSHIHQIGDIENLQSTLDRLENNASSGGDSGGGTSTTYDVATQTSNGLMSAEDKRQLDYGGIPIVEAYSSYGADYTATVNGMSELKIGAKITIIPNMTSASKIITLNVNNLGKVNIRIPSADNTSTDNISSSTDGTVTTWLSVGIPVTLQYNGMYWITTDFCPYLSKDYAPMYTYGTTDIIAGSASTAATGTLHFVYEVAETE